MASGIAPALFPRRVCRLTCTAYGLSVIEPTALTEGTALRRGLSPRESEVLEYTSRGLTNAQVAERLSISVHAVKFHLAAIYKKLGVANRTEATALYVRGGATLATRQERP
jgi:DNA-binding CsgD family transcriptional regulator